MPEIRTNQTGETIDAQTSTEGDDISDQHVALLLDIPHSPTSPRTSCAGLSSPSEDNTFTDDGYVSDGTIASFYHGQLNQRLSCW